MSRFQVDPLARARGPKRGGCLVSGLISLVIGLFVASMMTLIIAVAIWPGEAKLTAPLLCPDGQPDAFVVADTTQVQPGETNTSFTLYCMGERGDVTDRGFALPFALLTAFHLVLLVLLIGVFSVRGALRQRRRTAAVAASMASGAPAAAAVSGPAVSSSDETDFEPPGPIIS